MRHAVYMPGIENGSWRAQMRCVRQEMLATPANDVEEVWVHNS